MTINGNTKLFGFFADPANHSLSPIMYNTCFREDNLNCVYLAFKTNESNLEEAIKSMRALDIKGCNISMPNKTLVIDYLDIISEDARLCNSVNTVVNQEGVLTGYNTDIYGATKALQALDSKIKGETFTLLGLGGAGKAILTGLTMEGAKDVKVFLREKSMYKETAFLNKIRGYGNTKVEIFPIEDENILKEAISQSHGLINGTNVGMGSLENESLLPNSSFLHNNIIVMDAIYYPEETKLLRQAREGKVKNYSNGRLMLLYQGEKAYKLFTGKEMNLTLVKEVLGYDS